MNFEQKIDQYLNNFVHAIITPVVWAILAVSALVFLWGVVNFIITDEEKKRTAGKQHMIWGVVGLAISVGAWGIMAFINSSINSIL